MALMLENVLQMVACIQNILGQIHVLGLIRVTECQIFLLHMYVLQSVRYIKCCDV